MYFLGHRYGEHMLVCQGTVLSTTGMCVPLPFSLFLPAELCHWRRRSDWSPLCLQNQKGKNNLPSKLLWNDNTYLQGVSKLFTTFESFINNFAISHIVLGCMFHRLLCYFVWHTSGHSAMDCLRKNLLNHSYPILSENEIAYFMTQRKLKKHFAASNALTRRTIFELGTETLIGHATAWLHGAYFSLLSLRFFS